MLNWLTMSAEPALRRDDLDLSYTDEDRASDARARAEAKAGRRVSNEAVTRWLSTWGTGEITPPPTVGD